MLNFVLELIYPKTCGFCGKISKESICRKCEIKIEKEIRPKIISYKKQKDFDYHIYLFKYEGLLRKKIIEYKFNDKPYLYESFVKIIVNNKKICGFLKSYDIIIPVPMYYKKENKRGYNQAKLVARRLSKELKNLDFLDNCLIKKKDTRPQSSLNKIERLNNLNGVYKIENTQKIKDKKIILFDDVYTTGTTANECSRLLKQAGAKKVAVFTLAKD
jgi:competence protein ComFC